MKKKIVFIAPHLSTGGLPQYLFKQIELLKDEFDIYCVEWDNVTGGVLVIQRNRILKSLGNQLITLNEDKHRLFDVIENIQPDIIHLQEIPELFMPNDVADKLYAQSRNYVIIETSHDSSFDTNNKRYLPDKFFLVSQYQINQYKSLDIPCVLIEHPIEYKLRTKTREQALLQLGLDPAIKHVINVGLFTPRKNQAEIIEYAKALKDYPIQFHFLGNHADNFKFYWEPLMKDFPSNCKWWNERDDVDAFYEAADLFLFTSRGHETDKETMPLVIREAIGWNVPSLIYNLPVYLNYFDKHKNIDYLSEDFSKNVSSILDKLSLRPTPDVVEHRECIVVTAYIENKRTEDITKKTLQKLKEYNLPIILTAHTPIPTNIQEMVDYCVYDNKNILTSLPSVTTYWHNDENVKAHMYLDRENNNNSYHGPAAYTDIYNGMTLAHRLGFKIAHCFAYDIMPISDECLVDARQVLQTKKAFMHHKIENIEVGTYWFAMNTDFFMENFPVILSEDDYKKWVNTSNSESNSLEQIWYTVLKDKLNDIELLPDTKKFFDSILSGTRSELSSVLPIEGDPERCMFYIATNFGNEDSRIFKLYINDELMHTAEMRQNWYFNSYKFSELKTIKTELWYPDENKLYSTKTFVINEDYIKNKLKDNGFFIFKHKQHPDPQIDYGFEASWDMAEQKLYYSSKQSIEFPIRISVKEYKSTAVLWSFVTENHPANSLFWVLPIPKHVQNYESESHFTGVRFCVYNAETGEQLAEVPIILKDIDIPVVTLSNRLAYRINYVEFFIDKKYSPWIDKQHNTVVDIGANVGVFTEYMLRHGNANRVVAVECDSIALQDLQRNFHNNSQVTIIPKAMHHLNEPINFYEFSTNSLVSTTIDPKDLAHHGTGLLCDNIRTVETITLRSLVDEYDTLDLVKIDIEGAEYELIKNTDASVFNHIQSLLIECHSFEETFEEKYKELLDKLISMGYIIDGVPSTINFGMYDTIYAFKQ